MTRGEIENAYFTWMFNIICGVKEIDARQYIKLLSHLYEREFVYILMRDGNRASDGIDMRYRAGRTLGLTDPEVCYGLDYRECSLLEMMVALSIRCEESIMNDPDIGDRTGVWFWTMIQNLGLLDMTNENYDQDVVDKILDRLENRQYEPDGTGGLFIVKHPRRDMRLVDIWYQLNWYLCELNE